MYPPDCRSRQTGAGAGDSRIGLRDHGTGLLDRPLDEILTPRRDEVQRLPLAPRTTCAAIRRRWQKRERVAQAADVAIIFVSTAVGEDGETAIVRIRIFWRYMSS